MKLVKKNPETKQNYFNLYAISDECNFFFSEPDTDTLPAETSDNSTEESKLRKYFVFSDNIINAHEYAF